MWAQVARPLHACCLNMPRFPCMPANALSLNRAVGPCTVAQCRQSGKHADNMQNRGLSSVCLTRPNPVWQRQRIIMPKMCERVPAAARFRALKEERCNSC